MSSFDLVCHFVTGDFPVNNHNSKYFDFVKNMKKKENICKMLSLPLNTEAFKNFVCFFYPSAEQILLMPV